MKRLPRKSVEEKISLVYCVSYHQIHPFYTLRWTQGVVKANLQADEDDKLSEEELLGQVT